jgi:hypothetical protein
MVHICVVTAGIAILVDAALLLGIHYCPALRRRLSHTPTASTHRRDRRWLRALTLMYGI